MPLQIMNINSSCDDHYRYHYYHHLADKEPLRRWLGRARAHTHAHIRIHTYTYTCTCTYTLHLYIHTHTRIYILYLYILYNLFMNTYTHACIFISIDKRLECKWAVLANTRSVNWYVLCIINTLDISLCLRSHTQIRCLCICMSY